MNDRVIEAAAWRIWYRLKERGEATDTSLMANCGIEREVFDMAIDSLMEFQIEEVSHNDSTDESTYGLIDENARMMQVYPTIHRQEL